jgi:Fic family protein
LRHLPSIALGEEHLIRVHHAIVDKEFWENGYRTDQVYVGEALGPDRQHIHYIAPKPADVADMMTALLDSLEGDQASLIADLARQPDARGTVIRAAPAVDPVVHAAVLGFGFVFIHPFDDGNGRIHRYLIHVILSRRGFTPPNSIIPVSAAILRDRRGYDEVLEGISRPLMPLIDYVEAEDGVIQVCNDTAGFYRYLDLTPHAEYLYAKVEEAIEKDLRDELRYLTLYDAAKTAIRAIKDMPDRLETLFLQLTLQNQGRISPAKRSKHFPQLDDALIDRLESAVREVTQRMEPQE